MEKPGNHPKRFNESGIEIKPYYATAPMLLAMYLGVAEKQGCPSPR